MQLLKRQFGKKFINLLQKSPTAVEDVYRIRALGIKIRGTNKACMAYFERKTNTIYLGKNCPAEYKVISLAHEFSHAVINPTTDPIPRKTGKTEFVNRCLNEEATAILHEIKVAKELRAAGEILSPNEDGWLRVYKLGGKRNLVNRLRKTVTSNTGELYPEYYENWYDDLIKPEDRLP